ncbi:MULTISPECIES: hypothetical protein [unclassified Streptomyces]|uniref:hypothetical protein n=1 Tax=unclassified Streptomyces TaxID=2593676 RepID=UPI000C70802F|nr:MULTISPECIES: hypothetical protein [unclassified Streptomyces]AUH44853.1 hypothetical protein CXR04_12250 [Streptomyces sp. CMB-StM0423]WSA40146.1 hypothetical protein OG946_23935 [Streptomyces sp. NBC_01808]
MWKPNDVLLRSLAATQRLHRGRKRDRGQTAVEYLGIIAVSVVIVLVLIQSGLGDTILSKIKAQIDKLP